MAECLSLRPLSIRRSTNIVRGRSRSLEVVHRCRVPIALKYYVYALVDVNFATTEFRNDCIKGLTVKVYNTIQI